MGRLTARSFDQRTPDHDALLCECTTKEGAENIILQSIEEFFTGEFLKGTMLNAMWHLKELLYRGVLKYPKLRGKLGDDLRLFDHYLQLFNHIKYETDIEKLGDDLWLFDHLKYEKDIEYNYEVEKLVMKSDRDLFGYADLIIDYNVVIKPYFVFGELSLVFGEGPETDTSKIWLGYDPITIKKHGTILVELKPYIRDIGAVLRQVKTYRDYLPNITNTVIATFSEVSDNIRQLAQNENVIIVAFKGEIKEDSQKGKISPKQAAKMSEQPATEKQLEFLHELGYTGEIRNKLEASAIIDELLKKQQRE